MYKFYLASVVAVMLLSSSVFAIGYTPMGSIGQTQVFSGYGENYASQVGSHGTSVANNMTSVDQKNTLLNQCSSKLFQNEGSMLTQSANTSGNCGSLGVQQIGASSGDQSQLLSKLGCFNMTTQGQNLEVGLQQNATKDGGTGSAQGAQGSIAEQCQTILGNGTIMTSTQSIGATQMANVSGTKWSGGMAGNLVDVTASQTQMSN